MDPFSHRDFRLQGSYVPTNSFRQDLPTPQSSPTFLFQAQQNAPPISNQQRRITPPEEKSTIGESSHTVVREFKSPYDEIFAYLNSRNRFSEGGLSISMPMKDFSQLKAQLQLDEREQNYPRISYYSPTSSVIVQCMPGALHEDVVSTFIQGFGSACVGLPSDIHSKIHINTGLDFDGFEGRYAGSEKIADVGIQVCNINDKPEMRLVVEVGFSETYEDMVRDARLWLEGTSTVSTAVLVQLRESPKYACPTSNLDPDQFDYPSVTVMEDYLFGPDYAGQVYGPVVFSAFTWFGRLSSAFVETWRRDPTSGLAVLDGNRMDFLAPGSSPALTFRLSDLMPIPPAYDNNIVFNWDYLRSLLQRSVKSMAVKRYRNMMKAHVGRADIRDRDYQPN